MPRAAPSKDSQGRVDTAPPTVSHSDSSPLWAKLLLWLKEFIDLGDPRRNARLVQMAASALAGTGASIAKLTRSHNEMRGAERLLKNEHFGLSDLRAALYHLTSSSASAQSLRSLVVAFDPCELSFLNQPQKKDAGSIGDDCGRGYTWLNAAAIDPNSGRFVGVLHQALFSASGPDDRDEIDYAPGIFDPELEDRAARNFKQQFSVYAQAIDARVDPELELIFVGDSDFDDGLTLRQMSGLSARSHFVIRGDAQRVVQVARAPWLPTTLRTPSSQHLLAGTRNDPSLTMVYFGEIQNAVPVTPFRTLALDKRGRVCAADSKPARIAQLSIGSIAIRLPKASERGLWLGVEEKAAWLNLLIVRETNPPRGSKAVTWLLLTDMPCDTPEQLARIVDAYILRWRIEEFFRTVKDAMKVEQSRLQNADSTARLLFILTVKAMVLDALRTDAQLPAGTPPEASQRKQLREGRNEAERIEQAPDRTQRARRLSVRDRAMLVLALLAHYGHWQGHYKGSLGNYVLLSGLPFFLHDLSLGRFRWLVDPAPE